MNENRVRQTVQPPVSPPEEAELHLKMLNLEQVKMIDEALSEIGPFGEIRLIKAKGKLRFIQTLDSRSAL